jgi:hypothetical protein
MRSAQLIFLSLLSSTLLCGCYTNYRWSREEPFTKSEFQRDHYACQRESTRDRSIDHDLYVSCMEARSYTLKGTSHSFSRPNEP